MEGAGNGIRGLGAISAGDHPEWKQPVKCWKRVWHPTGQKFYYYNERTSVTCWEAPIALTASDLVEKEEATTEAAVEAMDDETRKANGLARLARDRLQSTLLSDAVRAPADAHRRSGVRPHG